MITIAIKTFKELSTEELYSILQLRSEVFVVEQNCVDQDIDFKVQNALHVIGVKDDAIVAYTRCFKPGFYFEEASIGRVVVKDKERKYGYGYDIMNASIKAIKDVYDTDTIKISAQTYLNTFYTNLGFSNLGEGYLEDGIPHIAMIKS